MIAMRRVDNQDSPLSGDFARPLIFPVVNGGSKNLDLNCISAKTVSTGWHLSILGYYPDIS